MTQAIVIIGQEFTLQVKYSKGSLAKFELFGFHLLTYDPPYVAIGSVTEEEIITNGKLDKV